MYEAMCLFEGVFAPQVNKLIKLSTVIDIRWTISNGLWSPCWRGANSSVQCNSVIDPEQRERYTGSRLE